MKLKIKTILPSLVLSGIFVSGFVQAALVNCGLVGSKNFCSIGDLIDEIFVVVNFLVGSATLLAIGYILYGGVRMITAYGNEGTVKDAKATITNALIGLVMVLVSYLIVTSVIAYLTGYSLADLRSKFFQF